jgi:hypothetical protein
MYSVSNTDNNTNDTLCRDEPQTDCLVRLLRHFNTLASSLNHDSVLADHDSAHNATPKFQLPDPHSLTFEARARREQL